MQPQDQFSNIAVTVIYSSNCNTSRQLIDELVPLIDGSSFPITVFDVVTDQVPDFAQSFIVPATYVGKTLWRYGRYPMESLQVRVAKEQSDQSPDIPD